jgi:hypothetical protein
MSDPLLIGPTAAFAAVTVYASSVAASEPGLVGEPFGLRAPGRVCTHLAIGLGSAISAPWPMAAVAAWAAARGTKHSAWAARTVGLVGAGVLVGTLAEPVTWGRRRASSMARVCIPLHLALGGSMVAAGVHRLRHQAGSVAVSPDVRALSAQLIRDNAPQGPGSGQVPGGGDWRARRRRVFARPGPGGTTQYRSTPRRLLMVVAAHVERGSVGSSRAVLYAVLVSSGVSLGGAALSVHTGLNPTYLDALGPQGFLSVPLPMMLFQVVTALAAGATRQGVAMLGSGLLSVAVSVAVASGFFDGGYADDRLGWAQRAYQMTLVASLSVVAALAVTRMHQVGRSGKGPHRP